MKDQAVSRLFEPFTLREITLRNRIMVSPMCQYSSPDGYANDWHLVHLGSRAVGGAGLVCFEATAVEPKGRISPWDLGLWEDGQIEGLARITRFIKEQGAVPALQLAHAGRKASTARPWDGGGVVAPEDGGWIPVGPSPIAFSDSHPVPEALDEAGIEAVVHAFRDGAERALRAGFEALELHAAHGYLLHSFLSPLSNQRKDRYGGSFENRIRLLLETVDAIREVWPERLPLLVRISSTDWVEGGWDVDQSVELCKLLAKRGVDLIDCSSGALVPYAKIPVGPGYQVPAAARIRNEAKIPVAAVGMIDDPHQAEEIIASGQADLVAIAREELRDPHFPLHAATRLGAEIPWPPQYQRARPSR